MIEAIQKRGASRVRAVCDTCGWGDTIHCPYIRKSASVTVPDEGAANKKLTSQKWVVTKGKHECPRCAAARRAFSQEKHETSGGDPVPAETTIPAGDDIRRPSRAQRRLIIMALENAYDDKAGRYRADYTDKSIAEDLGDGIMPGWVAIEREDLFGADGGNEEIAAIRVDIEKLADGFQTALAKVSAEYMGDIDALKKRLDAVCVAVGPRAPKVR